MLEKNKQDKTNKQKNPPTQPNSKTYNKRTSFIFLYFVATIYRTSMPYPSRMQKRKDCRAVVCFSGIAPPIFLFVLSQRNGCTLRGMCTFSGFIFTLSDYEYSSYFHFSESTHPSEQSQVSQYWCRTTACSTAADKPPLKKTRHIHTASPLARCLLAPILLPGGRNTKVNFFWHILVQRAWEN